MQVFKILKGFDRIQDNFLELDSNLRTRGHSFKLNTHWHRTKKRQLWSFVARGAGTMFKFGGGAAWS